MSLREILTLNYEGQQNIYGICHEQSILFKGGAYLVKRWVTYSWWYSHEKKDSEHTIESEKNFKRESADGSRVSCAGILCIFCACIIILLSVVKVFSLCSVLHVSLFVK